VGKLGEDIVAILGFALIAAILAYYYVGVSGILTAGASGVSNVISSYGTLLKSSYPKGA